MATRDLLEQALGSRELVNLTNNSVNADLNLNKATTDISLRNLEYQRSLAEQATIAQEANQNNIQRTAEITDEISQKSRELSEADSGSKAYRALYMVPILNIIPAIIDSNLEAKKEEISQRQAELTALNTATVTQDNNLTLQQKATEIRKAVSTEQFINAFEQKQNANAQIAGVEQNFKFLKAKVEVETEKLRQVQIKQAMSIASASERRQSSIDAARAKLLTLQTDQAQEAYNAIKQNREQTRNIIDSFNKSTGTEIDETTFNALPDNQKNFIIQLHTGLLRTPEDAWAAWQAYGFTDNNINLLPAGMRDQVAARIQFTRQTEQEFYSSPIQVDATGRVNATENQIKYMEQDPKTLQPTGRLDYNKVMLDYSTEMTNRIADQAGMSFYTNPQTQASREVIQVTQAQGKMKQNFTDIVSDAVETSLGLNQSEDKTLNVVTDIINQALEEQKAKGKQLGIEGIAPLVAAYPNINLFGNPTNPTAIPLTDASGNINRTKIKELIKGYRAKQYSGSNTSAIAGTGGWVETLRNYNAQNNKNISSATESNKQAIQSDQAANAGALQQGN